MKKPIITPKILPYAGATVQAALFSIAGQLAIPYAGWLVGLGAGAVVNYSIAVASSRINDIAEKRRPLARLSLLAMMVLSPVTITLSLFYPDSIYTAIAWAVCVDVAIVLAGAIKGGSLVDDSKPQAKPSGSQKSVKRKGAGAKTRTAEIQCRYAGCERKFATQNAANAHARNCSMRPTISMPIMTKESK